MRVSCASAGMIATSSLVGCQAVHSDSNSTESFTSKDAFKFGLIADTQWSIKDDGENPASVAVDIINAINDQFIKHEVSFAIALGDLTDDGGDETFTETSSKTGETYSYSYEDAYGIRARYAQALYNKGIGFFPFRGNHDAGPYAAAGFLKFFPQTIDGVNNVESAQKAAYEAKNPDEDYLPAIERTNTSTFSLGENFSSPDVDALKGLSYSFDYGNARFMMIDIYDSTEPISVSELLSQLTWVNDKLSNKDANSHAFMFCHPGFIQESNKTSLFGNPEDGTYYPAASAAYIQYMVDNNVKYQISGHDHMHDRSYIYTDDVNTTRICQLVGASASSKFYTPSKRTAAQTFDNIYKKRISQELYQIGYYIVTVDGPHVTFDYYASPAYTNKTFNSTTPTLNFALKESFGHSLNGNDYILDFGDAYTNVTLKSSSNTTATILDGTCGNKNADFLGNSLCVEVSTGFYDKTDDTNSDILYLRGMDYIMGSTITDVFTLSITYDDSIDDKSATNKSFGLAKFIDGRWVNTIEANTGGTAKFIKGPWAEGYELGTWGVDTKSKTVWAVINSNGHFAAANI